MIYSLSGTLEEKTAVEAVVRCGGVGYLVGMPSSSLAALPAVGSETTLYTVLNVTENDMSLFGFATREEREMFRMLTSVSGVGPKVALAILGALRPQDIVLAVSAGDHKAFTVASGVGPKLGQRLVLELKDKVAKSFAGGTIDYSGVAAATSVEMGGQQQAVAALLSLGYTQSEAAAAVAKIDPAIPVAEIIRLALRSMGGGG